MKVTTILEHSVSTSKQSVIDFEIRSAGIIFRDTDLLLQKLDKNNYFTHIINIFFNQIIYHF